MTVGIMSMQRILNYGSFLQAYALKSILEELNCDVQFVDYHIGDCLIKSNNTKKGVLRKIDKVLEVFKYKAPLKEKIRFIKYKKNYANKYFPYLGITDEFNYDTNLDLLVIGSDEVFNCVQDNTNVGYSKDLFGFSSEAKQNITYAASCGNTTIELLDKYNIKKEISDMLDKFDCISVRDNNTGKVVEQLTNKPPVYNLDPVLIYDFVNKCDDIPKKMTDEKYMILYGYSGRFSSEECKYIKEYAKKQNVKIYCIGGIQECCDKFIDCNPFEVISYFKNAEFVITDTFHGTILSVITQRRFATFVRKSGYSNSNKLIDLLTRLNLSNRVAQSENEIDKILKNMINYNDVNRIVKEERNKSYKYLEQAIIR